MKKYFPDNVLTKMEINSRMWLIKREVWKVMSEVDKIYVKGVMFMKSSGYVRQVDALGRLVLPIDLRKSLGIQAGEDSVEIFIDGDNKRVVLQKYNPPIPICIFCASKENVESFKGQTVCKNCLDELIKSKS